MDTGRIPAEPSTVSSPSARRRWFLGVTLGVVSLSAAIYSADPLFLVAGGMVLTFHGMACLRFMPCGPHERAIEDGTGAALITFGVLLAGICAPLVSIFVADR